MGGLARSDRLAGRRRPAVERAQAAPPLRCRVAARPRRPRPLEDSPRTRSSPPGSSPRAVRDAPRSVREFLLDHPDFASHVTRALGLARYRIWRDEATGSGSTTGGGEGPVHDRARRAGRARDVRARPLRAEADARHRGEAVATLTFAFSPGSNGRTMVSTSATGYAAGRQRLPEHARQGGGALDPGPGRQGGRDAPAHVRPGDERDRGVPGQGLPARAASGPTCRGPSSRSSAGSCGYPSERWSTLSPQGRGAGEGSGAAGCGKRHARGQCGGERARCRPGRLA